MDFKTDAIVLSQRKAYQNNQKYLTILTKDHGLIEVKIRPFGQISRNIYNNVTILGYYHFNIYQGRGLDTINSAEPKELFFDIRYDPKKLALAQYFCELTKLLIPLNQKANRHLSLLLNTLWKLQTTDQDEFIKSVFEFRILSYGGYMPNLVGCSDCNEYEGKKMYYMPLKSSIICDECKNKKKVENAIYIPKTVLHAMRYIIYKEDKEIFNFKIPMKYLDFFSKLTEYCILNIIEKELVTLSIYKQFLKG